MVIEDTESYYEDNRYHSIEYIKDHDLIDNALLVKPFLSGIKYNSIASLGTYYASTADVSFWVNYESLIDLGKESVVAELTEKMSSAFGGGVMKLPELSMYDNAQTLIEVSFLNNEATANVTAYVNDEFYAFTKTINNRKLQANVLAYLPETSPAYSGFAVDYTGMFNLYDDFFKQTMAGVPNFDTIAVESYELMKLFIDEEAIAKIFDGQGLVFLDGAHENIRSYKDYYYDDEYNYLSRDTTVTELVPSFFIVLGTQDIVTWGRIVRIIEQTGLLVKDGDIYTFTDRPRLSGGESKQIDFYMTLKNGVVAMGNDKSKLIELSNNKKVSKGISQKFNEVNSITYVDFKSLKTYLNKNDFSLPSIFGEAISDYDSMEFSGVKFNKGNFTYSMVVKSKNSEVNILQQFVNTIAKLDGK